LNAAPDTADEYEHAAAVCASRGLTRRSAADAVLATSTISPALREVIESDPDAFGERVSDYRYGEAMAGKRRR